MSCPICESENINNSLEVVELNNLGLSSVFLQNVQVTNCNECGYVSKSLPKQKLIKKELAETLCRVERPLIGAEFSYLRNHIGYTGLKLAKLLGTTNVSISRWEKEEHAIHAQADRSLRALVLSKLNRSIQLEDIMENISNNINEPIFIDVNRFAHTDRIKIKTAYAFGSSPVWVYDKVVNG